MCSRAKDGIRKGKSSTSELLISRHEFPFFPAHSPYDVFICRSLSNPCSSRTHALQNCVRGARLVLVRHLVGSSVHCLNENHQKGSARDHSSYVSGAESRRVSLNKIFILANWLVQRKARPSCRINVHDPSPSISNLAGFCSLDNYKSVGQDSISSLNVHPRGAQRCGNTVTRCRASRMR